MCTQKWKTLRNMAWRAKYMLMAVFVPTTLILTALHVSAASNVSALHVWGGTKNGVATTATVEADTEYTLTMYWKTDDETTRIYVGSTDIIHGCSAMNGASYDLATGVLSYTFKSTGSTVDVGAATYYSGSGDMSGDVHCYLAEPVLSKTSDASTINLDVSQWAAWYPGINLEILTMSTDDFAEADQLSALHVSGGTANGVSVSVPAQDGAEYTLSMYWKSDYATPGVYVEGANIITGNTSKADTANFDPATGLLTYTFTASGTEVSLDANTYAGGELTGDVHFYMADLVLTKTADNTVTSIPVSQLKAWYGGINLEVIAMSKTDFTVPVKKVIALHVSGGTENGASVQVPVEDGVEYTLSMYWKSDYATPGVYVGGTVIIAGNTPKVDAADFDPTTGLLTYTFTANGTTMDIGVNTYAGGEMTGDVHFYIAELFLTKTADNTATSIPVNQLAAWYGGINLEEIEMPQADFVVSVEEIETLHVSGGTQNGVYVTNIPVEDGEEYTLTMYWRTDYATPRVYVGTTDIIRGWTAMNSASFDPETGLLSYTFKAVGTTVDIGTATFCDSSIGMDGDVHYYFAKPILTKTADNTATELDVSEWTAWYGGINLEWINKRVDFFVSQIEPPSVQAGRVWTGTAGGAYSNDVTLVKGNRYTFSMRWLAKNGSTASVKLWQGSQMIQVMEGNQVQKGAQFNPDTGVLTYSFVAKEETFRVNCDAYNADGNVDTADGDVELYFAEPSLICLTDESALDMNLSKWTAYDANYEEVKVKIADFATIVKEDDRQKPVITMLPGARVRYAAPAKLRFETEISGLDELEDIGATYTVGTVVVPSDYVNDIEFTVDALEANALAYVDIPMTSWAAEPTEDADYYLLYTDFSGIEEDAYTHTYGARTYVEVTYADGVVRRYWSNYRAKDHARSVYFVADKALAKPAYTLSDKQQGGLEAYVNAVKSDKYQVMYVDWDESAQTLQVVQNYSISEDFMMIMKPLVGNNIFNIAPGKFLKDINGKVSSDIANAYWRNGAKFVDSDWLGPHIVNGDWTGGGHATNNNTTPTGKTTDIQLTVDGEEITGNISTYAKSLQVAWDNELYFTGSSTTALIEHYTMAFDGAVWDVHCELEFVSDLTWGTFYGMQCVYGYWCDNIRFDDGQPQTIAVAASGGEAYIVNSNIKNCEYMTVNKGTDWLEMYLDASYGIGDRRYLSSDNGAFAINYGGPSAGKAYFRLVGGDEKPSMKQGDVVSYRGHYRFYSE